MNVHRIDHDYDRDAERFSSEYEAETFVPPPEDEDFCADPYWEGF